MDLNNNDDPNLERRLILAFALVMALFLIVMPLFTKKSQLPPLPAAKPAPSAPAPSTPASATPIPAPAAPAAGAPTAAPTAKPGTPAKAAPAPPTPAVAAAAEQTVTLDTPVYHIALSNRGANVRSWVLTQYKDDRGQPLQMVDPLFSKKFGFPLGFWTQDASLRQQLDQALYQVTQSAAPGGGHTVTFHWAQGGVEATKTIRFANGYVADVQSQVTRNGQPVPVALAWPGAFGDRAVPGDFGTEQLFQQSGASLQTTKVSKVDNNATLEGSYQFAGLEDQYFAAAFLPQSPANSAGDATVTLTTLNSKYTPVLIDANGNRTTDKEVQTVGLAVATGNQNDLQLFVGPKKIDLLQSVNPALRGLVNFGWFSFVAYPLFLWMNWTYVHWIHNYGWVILFLTFVISMAFFPLKMKAQKSQAKMMALQPKVNAINAKMKKYGMRDPRRQEVQAELMQLYKDHDVNMFGGCLPMLVTLPLIYAFYDVLEYAIELRHAPWIGYIHDLSGKDPYFILPLIVVLTQFLTMQLMPMTAGQDPRQAKMMKWMMPIFMGWFFFYLPTGVNLYYLGYNIVSSGQQWVANKTYNAAAVAAVAAKDARGGGAKKKIIEGKVVRDKG